MNNFKGDFLNIMIFFAPSDSRFTNSCISDRYCPISVLKNEPLWLCLCSRIIFLSRLADALKWISGSTHQFCLNHSSAARSLNWRSKSNAWSDSFIFIMSVQIFSRCSADEREPEEMKLLPRGSARAQLPNYMREGEESQLRSHPISIKIRVDRCIFHKTSTKSFPNFIFMSKNLHTFCTHTHIYVYIYTTLFLINFLFIFMSNVDILLVVLYIYFLLCLYRCFIKF